jgi:acetate---CoA ligase (ADP-forming)
VSGGATALIGDLGDAAGLHFPPIAETSGRRIRQILGIERELANPLDTVGLPRLRRERNLSAVLQVLLQDEGIDVIGLVLGMRADGWESHRELVDQLAETAKTSTKPLMVVSFMSNGLTRYWRGYAGAHDLPVLEDLERGLRAVRHLVDYGAFRRRADSRDSRRVREPMRVEEFPDSSIELLTEAESKQILAKAGMPVTREALANSASDAIRIAAEIGGRVALKVQSRDIPHKSDVGGVYLGAATAAEVERAATQVLHNARRHCPQAAIDGVLVQEMIEDGAEFILGMTYDAQFGPLVVCGAGGTEVEIFKDVAVLLPPFSADDVTAALRGLKASKLLDGFRGAPALDFAALVECCMRFGAFAAATEGRFAAIDLNPVFVRPQGLGVRIGDALMQYRVQRECDHG